MKYDDTIAALISEILGTWDAAEDNGSGLLASALARASYNGQQYLAQQVLEGTVEMVFEQLLLNDNANEVLNLIRRYRQSQQ